MRVVHEQLDRLAVLAGACPLAIDRHALDPSGSRLGGPLGNDSDLLVELHVELDEQQRLVPNGREQVELADEIEDVWATEAKVERERLPRLSIEHKAGDRRSSE